MTSYLFFMIFHNIFADAYEIVDAYENPGIHANLYTSFLLPLTENLLVIGFTKEISFKCNEF